MPQAVQLLREIGFSEYEARAYLALVRRGPQTGYELARHSRIPRPNVYGVLQRLEDRGAVLRVETARGLRYAPVTPAQLTRRLGARFAEALESAARVLESAARGRTAEGEEWVWNARGRRAALEHAGDAVDAARRALLVALWPEEARALADRMEAAESRGVEITTLCFAACPQECGGCRGRVFRHRMAPENGSRWLLVLPDGESVVAAEVGTGESGLAVGTGQRLWVELAGWYVRHSIALAAVLGDLGGGLKGLLSEETQAILGTLAPGPSTRCWLDHVLGLLSRPPAVEA